MGKKRGPFKKTIKKNKILAKNKERGLKERKLIKGLSKEFLSPEDLKFCDDYMKTGMQKAWKSYQKAFGCKEGSAKARAYQLLKQDRIIKELNARAKASGMTDDWVNDIAKKYIEKGLIDKSYAGAGTKALQLVAQFRGMLVDVMRHEFDEGNPAIFVAPYDKKKLKDIPRLVE